MLTGSYHNYFRIFDVDSLNDVVLQADKSAFKQKKIGGPIPGNKQGAKNGTRGLRDAMQLEPLDFTKKILHASWHPRESTIAVRFVSTVFPWLYLLYSSRLLQRTTCSYTALRKVPRDLVCLCVVVFVFPVLKYILRSLFNHPLTLSTPPLPAIHLLPFVPVPALVFSLHHI